jgi:hypothetical protein
MRNIIISVNRLAQIIPRSEIFQKDAPKSVRNESDKVCPVYKTREPYRSYRI